MRCQKAPAAAALIVFVCAGGAASADVDVTPLYQTAFESVNFPGQWSRRDHSRTGVFTGYLGRFGGDDAVTLTLGAIEAPPKPPGGGGGGGGDDDGWPGEYLPGDFAVPGDLMDGDLHGRDNDPRVLYRLTFDLFVIDSWDSDAHADGPDSFSVSVNGKTYFDEVLSNHPSAVNFKEPEVGPAGLGYAEWKDSIFRDIEVWFEVEPTDELLSITFAGSLNQELEDESWGIDNVRVGYVITPSPGAGGLLGCGAVVMAFRRRRRKN